jgi:hypothetical protein
MGWPSVAPLGCGVLALSFDTAGRVAFVIVVGAVALFVIWFQFLEVRTLYGRGDSTPPEQLTNCPSCGARLPVDAERCDHCDEPLDR